MILFDRFAFLIFVVIGKYFNDENLGMCVCSVVNIWRRGIPYTGKFWRPLSLAKWPEMAQYKIWRFLKFGDRNGKL